MSINSHVMDRRHSHPQRLRVTVAGKGLQGACRPRRPAQKPEISAIGFVAIPRRHWRRSRQAACHVVRTLAEEMVFLVGGPTFDRDRRFAIAHIQQIAMYICHVVLQLSLTEIGRAFGRDRTTVAHACARVEDRRDDPAYDQLLTAIERIVESLAVRQMPLSFRIKH